MKSHAFRPPTTPHKARCYGLGEPGPDIRHVWMCLHGYDQPVADLAAQLVNLNTPERLLMLPEAPEPTSGPAPARRWFESSSLGPDLALVCSYLDELTTHILRTCLPRHATDGPRLRARRHGRTGEQKRGRKADK